MSELDISVKCGKQTHQVVLSASAAVAELQAALVEPSGIMARKQKLIFKGKVLSSTQTLREAGLATGSKVMLMASAGGPTQGQVAAAEVSRAKAQAAGERAELGRRAAAASAAARNVVKARAEGWAKTGIVSLLNEGLATVPEAAWQVGAAMRALELSGNRLTALPGAAVVELHGLRVLRLAGNHLTAAGVPWPELAGCPSLLTLVLDGNPLGELPATVGGLSQLRTLSLASCSLQQLSETVGHLQHLITLDLSQNRLQELPASLGDCSALERLIADSNQLAALPDSLRRLQSLAVISAAHNRLETVPARVLRECGSLSALHLQDNPLTAEALRELDGFDAYNVRRLAKCNKQIDGRVSAVASSFDEGADVQQWQRF